MANVQPTYNVVIKLPSGDQYEFNQATDVAWERYENVPGRCKFSIPWNDPKIAAALATDTQFIQIFIYRNQVLVWQGFVAMIEDSLQKTTIYGLSLLECLKWYRSGYNITYTGKKIGTEILSPVWDTIDVKSGAILGDLIKKGTFEDPYQTGNTTAKTVSKTLYDEDFYTLCYLMVALSSSNSPTGAWIQNTVMDISLSETAPTFSFTRNVGENRPDVVFELNSEITDFVQTKDYRFIRNDVKGLSVVEGPKVLTSTQTDSTSNTAYYLRELGIVFENVTAQDGLDENTKNYLKEAKDPATNWTMSFVSGMVPFDGYVMGDNVKVRINQGRLNIDAYHRVIGMEVSVTNDGAEIAKPILRRVRT